MNILHLDLPRAAHIESAVRPSSAPEFPAPRETAAERLQDLDEEWSIEGLFEGAAAIVGIATFAVGLAVDDRWLVLSLVISALLLQQTLQGWCPALPLLRGLGFRTEREIQLERQLLQQLEDQHAPCPFPSSSSEQRAPARQNHHVMSGPEGACSTAFSLRDFLVRPSA